MEQQQQAEKFAGQKRTNSQRQPFFRRDPAQDQLFEETKRKYAAAICYILASDITVSGLYDFLQADDASQKVATLKTFRSQLLDLRPNAKQYLDKPYYLDLTIIKFDKQNGIVKLAIGGVVFKYDIRVIQTEPELAQYLRTLSQILQNDAIWDDPIMEIFKPQVLTQQQMTQLQMVPPVYSPPPMNPFACPGQTPGNNSLNVFQG